jgi:hypothetical protein
MMALLAVSASGLQSLSFPFRSGINVDAGAQDKAAIRASWNLTTIEYIDEQKEHRYSSRPETRGVFWNGSSAR